MKQLFAIYPSVDNVAINATNGLSGKSGIAVIRTEVDSPVPIMFVIGKMMIPIWSVVKT